MATPTIFAEHIRPITIGAWTLHHFIDEPEGRSAQSFHTARHVDGTEVSIDWAPNEVMERVDFQRWLDLGQPRRGRYDLVRPLHADLIRAAFIERMRAVREVAAGVAA